MARLETTEHWAQILELKDQLSLRELATRFDTTPGVISAALRRTSTGRTIVAAAAPAPAAPAPKKRTKKRADPTPAPAPAAPLAPGERPAWWATIEADLNNAPLYELAARAGITVGELARTLRELDYRRVPLTNASKSRAASRPAPRPAPVQSTGLQAWAVAVDRDGQASQVVVVAASLSEAAAKVQAIPGTVTQLTLLGEAIV